jgi:hypothetical protein
MRLKVRAALNRRADDSLRTEDDEFPALETLLNEWEKWATQAEGTKESWPKEVKVAREKLKAAIQKDISTITELLDDGQFA